MPPRGCRRPFSLIAAGHPFGALAQGLCDMMADAKTHSAAQIRPRARICVAAFLDMVSVEAVGRVGDRAALPVFHPFAAVAGALEHRGGPFAVICGLEMLASLAGCAQADALGGASGQAERFGSHAISVRPYRLCAGCGRHWARSEAASRGGGGPARAWIG